MRAALLQWFTTAFQQPHCCSTLRAHRLQAVFCILTQPQYCSVQPKTTTQVAVSFAFHSPIVVCLQSCNFQAPSPTTRPTVWLHFEVMPVAYAGQQGCGCSLQCQAWPAPSASGFHLPFLAICAIALIILYLVDALVQMAITSARRQPPIARFTSPTTKSSRHCPARRRTTSAFSGNTTQTLTVSRVMWLIIAVPRFINPCRTPVSNKGITSALRILTLDRKLAPLHGWKFRHR